MKLLDLAYNKLINHQKDMPTEAEKLKFMPSSQADYLQTHLKVVLVGDRMMFFSKSKKRENICTLRFFLRSFSCTSKFWWIFSLSFSAQLSEWNFRTSKYSGSSSVGLKIFERNLSLKEFSTKCCFSITLFGSDLTWQKLCW